MKDVGKFKGLADRYQRGFENDRISQEIANIPLKIDEKITELKDVFDKLLGKIPGMDPGSPLFDIQQQIRLIEAAINPVIKATSPLASITGPFPVIGDLFKLLSVASSSSSAPPSMTEEEIKKIIGENLPDIPPGLKDRAHGLMEDIKDVIPVFPMLLINLIFAILNVIYSKLQIITSVIPLGSLFPMNLIPAAITAIPLLIEMMLKLPGYCWNLIDGMIKRKIALALAGKIPQTSVDADTLKELVNEYWDNQRTKRAQTEKNPTYESVINKFYLERGHAMGYTIMQLKEILRNYLKIHDSTDIELTNFENNYEQDKHDPEKDRSEQDLANFGFSAMLGFSSDPYGGLDKSKENLGYKKGEKVKRSAPSPREFETYLNKTVKTFEPVDKPDDPDWAKDENNTKYIEYQKIYDLKDILGGYYDSLRKQVTKNDNVTDPVVLTEEMKKSPVRTGDFLKRDKNNGEQNAE